MTEAQIWEMLKEVPDPEIPVLSIIDLGVVRNVILDEAGVYIDITPTYSGCPAMNVFEQDIVSRLEKSGLKNIQIRKVFTPAWTTDWISEDAKKRLKAYGIAPPEMTTADKSALWETEAKVVPCPFCDSQNTKLTSQFGSTACKSLHFCDGCHQPFEHFKCI